MTSIKHRRAGLAFLGLGAAATALAFTFSLNDNTGLPVKWPAGTIPITIKLGDSTTPLIDGEASFNTSARTAANVWNAQLGSAQFQAVFGATGSPVDNNDTSEIGFAASYQLAGEEKQFGANTLAVTTGYTIGNERTEADIIFNTAYKWDSYRGALREDEDLKRVAIHELGHVLGLDHPDEAVPAQNVNAIMRSQISNLDTLASDDIEGAQSLYGPPGIPANNAFASATVITLNSSGSVTLKGVNTNATKEAGEPRHADNPGGRSVWWRWTAPSSGSIILDTRGSYYDTTLGVYTGNSVSSLILVNTDDDIEDGVIQASEITLNVTGGTVYRIAVDGFNNIVQNTADTAGADNGGITLNLNFTPIAGAPAITNQPVSVTVTVGGSANFSVSATGTDPLAYQWLFNDVSIAGATNATFSVTSAQTSNAGTYRVRVTNNLGSSVSNDATLTVNQPPAPPPPPPSSGGGGGGGGGGAPSLWFCAALAALGLGRLLNGRNLRPET